jgi:uncharacterized membrane protein
MEGRLKPVRYDASASITITRSVPEVFGFYANLENLPLFLGDVLSVEKIGASLYRWKIAGPFGVKIHWKVRVTELCENRLIRYQTVSRLQSVWTVVFLAIPGQDTTFIEERMTLPFGAAGKTLLGLVGKPPAAEMASNLHRLKQLLENGLITDRSHAVPGKFLQHPTA